MTHLIRLTSNAPPDVVSKCELTSFAFSISEIHRGGKRENIFVKLFFFFLLAHSKHVNIITIFIFMLL